MDSSETAERVESKERWYDLIDKKISVGTIILILTQLIGAVVYITLNLSTLKSLEVTVTSLLKTQDIMNVSVPLQTQSITNLTKSVDELSRHLEDQRTALGNVQQTISGFKSDISQLHDQYHDLVVTSQQTGSSNTRTPRR